MSLPNIISSVAVRSLSLNWINIWDITIYQLFNEFERLQIIDQYDIASTQVSVWGDKEKKFKFGAWSSIYITKMTLSNSVSFLLQKKQILYRRKLNGKSIWKQMANREVCDMVFVDYKTKEPFLFCDYANTSSQELTGENVFAYGGKGHPKKITFSGERVVLLRLKRRFRH